MTVSQQAQHQEPETDGAKWNSANIHIIIYTCASLRHVKMSPVKRDFEPGEQIIKCHQFNNLINFREGTVQWRI